MQLSTKDAIRIMAKLEVVFTGCKHHRRGFLIVDGKAVLAVYCSNGHKDMPGNIPHRFRKSLHMDPDEFDSFKTCTLSRSEYIELLRLKGVI